MKQISWPCFNGRHRVRIRPLIIKTLNNNQLPNFRISPFSFFFFLEAHQNPDPTFLFNLHQLLIKSPFCHNEKLILLLIEIHFFSVGEATSYQFGRFTCSIRITAITLLIKSFLFSLLPTTELSFLPLSVKPVSAVDMSVSFSPWRKKMTPILIFFPILIFCIFWKNFLFQCFPYYFTLSKILTTPLSASTSTKSPSRRTCVANFVPMMQGLPSSRDTIAAWHVIPPSSVMMPPAFCMAGMKSGVVMVETIISPFELPESVLFRIIILTMPFV